MLLPCAATQLPEDHTERVDVGGIRVLAEARDLTDLYGFLEGFSTAKFFSLSSYILLLLLVFFFLFLERGT